MSKVFKLIALPMFALALLCGAVNINHDVNARETVGVVQLNNEGIDLTQDEGNTHKSDGDIYKSFADGVTPDAESNKAAKQAIAPFTSILKVLTSAMIAIATTWLFVQTAIDIVYLTVPFLRGLMSPQKNMSAPSGMNGGFGGSQAPQTKGGLGMFNPFQPSDEAMQALEQGGNNVASANFSGGSGGMGMGMGGRMGGMGMGMGGQQQQSQSKPHILGVYLKKRAFTMVLLGVGIVVLMSSFLFDFGLDTGGFLLEAFDQVRDLLNLY